MYQPSPNVGPKGGGRDRIWGSTVGGGGACLNEAEVKGHEDQRHRPSQYKHIDVSKKPMYKAADLHVFSALFPT